MNRSYPYLAICVAGAWLVCVSAISYRNGVEVARRHWEKNLPSIYRLWERSYIEQLEMEKKCE